MRLISLIVAVAATFLAAPAALAACDAPTVLFADNFDKLQPTWGEASDALKVADGKLVVSPAAEQYFWTPNTAGVYDDIDLCVNVTTVAGVDPVDAKVGVVFWYVDVNNFYVFEIAPNGKASVWRRQRGKWLSQVNWQTAEGANQGDGVVNALEVQTVGPQATLSINGNQFKQFTGSAPDSGQQIGILAVSPAKGAATFAFDDLKVVLPPKQ